MGVRLEAPEECDAASRLGPEVIGGGWLSFGGHKLQVEPGWAGQASVRPGGVGSYEAPGRVVGAICQEFAAAPDGERLQGFVD